MSELELRVEKAYPNDAGRGVARLDPDVMDELGVEPGQTISIEGDRETGATVWRADRDDWGDGTIRIDGFTRQNAGVGIGEKVSVEGITVATAEQVVLAPPADTGIEFDDGAEGMVKKQLLERPVSSEDVVPILSNTNHPFIRSPGEAIPLIVVDATSSDSSSTILSVSEETEIQMRDSPVQSGVTTQTRDTMSYEEIGGLDDEIQRVREMIELPMNHPDVFDKLGIEPPKGVLLHGPPGTGKTLLARAVANETGASFTSINGPEIISKYYGESEGQLREVFDEAEENAPAIIFIDEIDSIAPNRSDVQGEVERRVVAQLLSLMDGIEKRGRVVVIAATNRVNSVDPALRRPGRFDREIEIGVPDEESRQEIFQIHTRGMPLAGDVDTTSLAEETHGFTGADIESLTKEAAMTALRRYLPEIDLEAESVPPGLIDRMLVKRGDFRDALRSVEPSAMREIIAELPDVTWNDIGGLDEPRQHLEESVEWPLNQPEKFERMGIEPPSGVLLYGPPGTGKTLLAKAVANESEANFISVNGPEMLSKWVGESEEAVRETFQKAREVAPCVIFFDELDSIASRRAEAGGGNNVSERVVNQFLTELDGLQSREQVIVIGATNRPDMLDQALVRPGRFGRLVRVGVPSEGEREEILQVHTRDTPLDTDVTVSRLAELTDGYVGSDLEALCREAAIEAIRDGDESVTLDHFRVALDSVSPTVDDGMLEYYDSIEENFGGGADPTGGSDDSRAFY